MSHSGTVRDQHRPHQRYQAASSCRPSVFLRRNRFQQNTKPHDVPKTTGVDSMARIFAARIPSAASGESFAKVRTYIASSISVMMVLPITASTAERTNETIPNDTTPFSTTTIIMKPTSPIVPTNVKSQPLRFNENNRSVASWQIGRANRR